MAFAFAPTTENAVGVLLRAPALYFVRELRSKLDRDPKYLRSHKAEITPRLEELLLNGGIIWDRTIVERESISLLKDAINRLRRIEKGRTHHTAA